MDSSIETSACPLDPDVMRLWKPFRFEASKSDISFDYSEFVDKENKIVNDDLVSQLKTLSVVDISDIKLASSKQCNKITEINYLKKNNAEKHIAVVDKKNDTNQASLLDDNELLNCLGDTDVKNDSKTEKHIDVGKEKSSENKFSLLMNDELLKFVVETNVESDSNTFSREESNSDSENQGSSFKDTELLKFLEKTDVKNDSKIERHIDVDLKRGYENQFSLLMNDEEQNFIIKTTIKSDSDTKIHICADKKRHNENQAPLLKKDELLQYTFETNVNSSYDSSKVLSSEESDSDNESQDLLFKDTELLKLLEETNIKIDSKTEKHIDVDYKGNNENWSSVISDELPNFIVVNGVKSDSNTFYGDKSDSDSDEQAESANLRGRSPQRSNRPKNHKQLRPAPFPQHHTQTYKLPFNSSHSQLPVNINPMLENINLSHGSYNSLYRINSTISESHHTLFPSSTTFCSCVPTSGSVTDEVYDCFYPCSVTNNSVPYLIEFENVCENFSPEVNSIPCVDDFDKLCKEISSESNDMGCAVTMIGENILDSHCGFLSTDEVSHILTNLTESKSNCSFGQSSINSTAHVDIFQNLEENILSGSGAISYAGTNAEIDNILDSHCELLSTDEVNQILRNLAQSQSNCHLDQNHVDTAELNPSVSLLSDSEVESILNISSESSQDCSNGSFGKENSYPRQIYFNFDLGFNPVLEETDETALQVEKEKSAEEQENVSEIFNPEINCPGNHTKHIDNPRTCKSENRKISSIFKTVARDKLLYSSSFCERKWKAENEEIRRNIKMGKLGTENNKVIHFLKKDRNNKYTGTNLHYAIKSGNTEKVFCIVEYHKLYHDTFEINLRDSCNKTVLDYSMERKMDLLTDYLVENHAKNSIGLKKVVADVIRRKEVKQKNSIHL